jgi:glutamate dehydrogenase (NADP+)
VSGSGNVAQYTIEKLIDLGARAVTVSDSDGYVYDEEGFDREKLAFLIDLKNVRRGRVAEYAERFPRAVYTAVDRSLGYNPLWTHAADCAFPSATQNEIEETDAANLIANGVAAVAEGANMPCNLGAARMLIEAGVLYAPGKAANAGGVATSGLEMAQNSARMTWPREQVDRELRGIMKSIHHACRETSEHYGVGGNYVHGANIAGFTKVADAMLDQGLV